MVNYSHTLILHGYGDIEIKDWQILGWRPWPFRGHVMSSIMWPLGSQCVYHRWLFIMLSLFCTVMEICNILGLRPEPFRVTWRHQSCDHWSRNTWFPTSDPLKPPLYLAWLLWYCVLNIYRRRFPLKMQWSRFFWELGGKLGEGGKLFFGFMP